MKTQFPRNTFIDNITAQQQNTEELPYRDEQGKRVWECEDDEQAAALLSNIGQVMYDWGYDDFNVRVHYCPNGIIEVAVEEE